MNEPAPYEWEMNDNERADIISLIDTHYIAHLTEAGWNTPHTLHALADTSDNPHDCHSGAPAATIMDMRPHVWQAFHDNHLTTMDYTHHEYMDADTTAYPTCPRDYTDRQRDIQHVLTDPRVHDDGQHTFDRIHSGVNRVREQGIILHRWTLPDGTHLVIAARYADARPTPGTHGNRDRHTLGIIMEAQGKLNDMRDTLDTLTETMGTHISPTARQHIHMAASSLDDALGSLHEQETELEDRIGEDDAR